jgi:hypothetical protein
VAIESRKHAASRPSPPFPSPASGSCSSSESQSRDDCSTTSLTRGPTLKLVMLLASERPIRNSIERVVDTLRVRFLVGLIREEPSLREKVPDGAREGLVALTRTGGRGKSDVVEEQVPLVDCVRVARELPPGPIRIDEAMPPSRQMRWQVRKQPSCVRSLPCFFRGYRTVPSGRVVRLPHPCVPPSRPRSRYRIRDWSRDCKHGAERPGECR